MSIRRLAVILAADVAGFSKLMESNEDDTADCIRSLREKVFEPVLQRHQGRLVKTSGDGFLAEFASPVQAVRSAIAIQDELTSSALKLRIGINLGDILVEDDGDILGDAVNVAARLEQMTASGGVTLAEDVYRHITGKIDRQFEDLGEQRLKNIRRPVRAYSLLNSEAGIPPYLALPLPDKPSIAVLPFRNISGEAEQEYFADGISEDLAIALSRIRWLFVIARNSTFVFKGRVIDVKEIGKLLGVRYLLEGSVRKVSGRVRVTAQLVEASGGVQIWAERYDRELTDIFAVQDEISEKVVFAIEPNVLKVEMARARAKRTDNLDAYDLYLRAMSEIHCNTEDGYRIARLLLQKAVQQDPSFAEAWASIADCISRMATAGWIEWEVAKEHGCRAAIRAVEADPANGSSLATAAFALAFLGGRLDQAHELAKRASGLHLNSAVVCVQSAWVLVYNGEYQRALDLLSAARRLSPLDPRRYLSNSCTAQALLALGRFEESLHWSDQTLQSWPHHSIALRLRAIALVNLKRLAEAKQTVSKLLEIHPSVTLRSVARVIFRDPAVSKVRDDALRSAGLPD